MDNEVKNGVNKGIKQRFREQMGIEFIDGKNEEAHPNSMSSKTQWKEKRFNVD